LKDQFKKTITMLNNFFTINLPYGIARTESGEWMAFNREYLPLGFCDESLKALPGYSYTLLPVYCKYKNISEAELAKLAGSDSQILRNEHGEIVRVILYDSATNPANQPEDNPTLWKKYFDKLKVLSKWEV
jgi:hypothetical protein